MRTISYYSFVFLFFLFLSCQNYREDKARSEILALQEQQKKEHLDKNVDLLVDQFSDHFTEISKGRVLKPSRAESKSRFAKYFGQVDLLEWSDTEKPVITISNDGTMSFVVNQKRVVGVDRVSGIKDTTLFAWVSIYRKYDYKWKLDCIASTNR